MNWGILAAGPAALLTAVLLQTTESHATNTANATCSSVGAGTLVADDTETNIDLAEGDQLTVSVGSQLFDAFVTIPGGGSVFVGVLTSQTFTVEAGQVGQWNIGRTPGTAAGGSDTTLSCAAAADAAVNDVPSTQDVQNAFSSQMMMSHLGNLYDEMHRNTSGVLNGTASNSVTGNGFFLQSAGKAAKDIPGAQPSLNVFVSAEVASFDGDSFDGLTGDLTLGIDYRVSRDVVVGGLVSAGRADFSTLVNANVGSLENSGYTVGVYAAAKVYGDLTLDALLTYSGLDYDVANGGTTGDFDATRLGISVGIYNQLPFMGVTLEPHARVVYGIEEQDGYTDSVGNAVGSNTVNAGRITLGPRLIGPSINGFAPWVSASGVYEFSDAGNLATGAPDFDDTFSGSVGLGFDWDTELGMLGGEVTFGGLGSGLYHSVSGRLQYGLAF